MPEHHTQERAAVTERGACYPDNALSLPEIYRHLADMRTFIGKCRQHFPGGNILEIGTGTGVLAVYFSQMGYAVTGLDSRPETVAANQMLNRGLQGRARFVVGDLFRLPFAPNTFDACYHQGLMECFDPPDIVRALRLQTEVCRRVIFAVPTRRWPGGVRGDERLWEASHWLKLLGGFKVVDMFGASYRSFVDRGLNFAGRRFLGYRPRVLYDQLALKRAGQIGFVITHP